MKILAIETATEACSAALSIDGELRDVFKVAPREHSQLILPMVEGLLSEADMALSQLDAIAFGRGPGSFTGVRMAVSVTQGLAFSCDLPVVPVSTLKALAQQKAKEVDATRIYASLDARMGEVYWAEYTVQHQQLEQVGGEHVLPPQHISCLAQQNAIGIGHGWRTYQDILTEKVNATSLRLDQDALPRAKEIVELAVPVVRSGDVVSAEHALPVYLRDNVAKKKAQQ